MRRLAPLVLAVMVLPLPASAQQGEPVTYSITRAGAEIGNEVATLSAGDAGNPGGTTLVVRAHYPGSVRDSALEAMLQRDGAGQFVLFQLDLHDESGGSTILAAGSGARVLLRTDTPGSRAVREVPSGENVVLLDDHVLSLYQAVADLASPAGTRMVGIYPRSGRRVQFEARRGDGDQARRITLSGQLTGTLLVSESGRLLRAELPAGLVAAAR
ncbi:MAG TPA: hypothetical protein VFL88_09925 [Gemmatimonadales bacterium]|nr:hypothetical protein [Gemmatimonadales bacterium]